MTWKHALNKNAPLLLAIASSVGVAITVISAIKATPKAMSLVLDEQVSRDYDSLVEETETSEDGHVKELTKKDIVKLTWKCYIPTAILALSTIACIFGSNALNKRQQAALASAYALLAQSYSKYKNEVRNFVGEEDYRKIEQDLALTKQVKGVLKETHPGELMHWYDEFSDQFFDASEEDVLRAEYDLNRIYALDHEVNLNTFYELLGLEDTDGGTEVGWSLEASDFFYGYEWIDFHHDLCTKDDGTEYYKITMPYPPTSDYISDTPPDC